MATPSVRNHSATPYSTISGASGHITVPTVAAGSVMVVFLPFARFSAALTKPKVTGTGWTKLATFTPGTTTGTVGGVFYVKKTTAGGTAQITITKGANGTINTGDVGATRAIGYAECTNTGTLLDFMATVLWNTNVATKTITGTPPHATGEMVLIYCVTGSGTINQGGITGTFTVHSSSFTSLNAHSYRYSLTTGSHPPGYIYGWKVGGSGAPTATVHDSSTQSLTQIRSRIFMLALKAGGTTPTPTPKASPAKPTIVRQSVKRAGNYAVGILRRLLPKVCPRVKHRGILIPG